jgi:hypothetical protein
MTGEQFFILLIVIIVAAVIAPGIAQASKNRHRINRVALDRFYISPEVAPPKPNQPASASESQVLTAEESSKVELARLQKLINDRMKIAWETDISYHLWNLYKTHFRCIGPQLLNRYSQDGKWYELKTLKASTINDLNKFEFELNGTRYKFVDDEEKQGISDNMKLFNLFLYDDSDRCLMDIPMKLRVDDTGKKYSISSDSPKAFLLGDWINDFISVSLKHQNIRNQEIRAQKHQERLREIEELKDKFGISD